jgi:anti-anti-sigma factor
MFLSVRLTTLSDTAVVLTLTGELDSTTSPVLAATLGPLAESPVTHVIVAAGDLWFCDLTGLDQLAATHLILYAKGGGLAVAEAGPALCRLIELVTEHSRAPLTVYDTMQEALAGAGMATDDEQAPVARRHLPRLRRVQHIQPARAAQPPAVRPRPVKAEVAELAPVTAVGAHTKITPAYTAIARAHALREQAESQMRAIEQQISRSDQARRKLDETRARCKETVSAVRATVARATQTLAAGAPPASAGG